MLEVSQVFCIHARSGAAPLAAFQINVTQF
jgi:hypothetical protein